MPSLNRSFRHSPLVPATLLAAALSVGARAQQPTEVRLSFADAVHHVMEVEETFRDVGQQPLSLHMSRSSPGRYAAFEFAGNVFEEHFSDGGGRPLPVSRPNPRSWAVTSPDGIVHVAYRLFGDKVDGTFLAIDTTHAHLNFPAVLLWADGLDDRPWRVSFVPPADSGWKIATQLYPTSDPATFTAPNFQYLMDSPAELSQFVLRSFVVPPLLPGGDPQTIRVAAHSQATSAELDTYVAGVQKLVREEQAVFGELPAFEPGYYTFLADALPWDNGDGMEHRNSTVVTGTRLSLAAAAHEFFHCWNVERIRPEGLEPFNFRDVNMSGEMFLAEGFTQYFGNLAMLRTGLTPGGSLRGFAGDLSYLLSNPGSRYRSAVDMSRLAPLVDGSSDAFPEYWNNDFVSYYSFGDVVALGLDLTLRARSGSRVSLDDFMRAMWRAYGKPAGPAPGLVAHPYTLADVQTQLAAVSGDPTFAADFVSRYIAGTERLDYASLLLHGGFLLRSAAGPPSLGPLRLVKDDKSLRVAASTLIGSPAYRAGLDRDDDLLSVAGVSLASPEDLTKALKSHTAGETVELIFRRRGEPVHASATLVPSPELEIVPVESAGGSLSEEQKQFRAAWLGSKVH